MVNLMQTGIGNYANISQNGNFNKATVTQSGGAAVMINGN